VLYAAIHDDRSFTGKLISLVQYATEPSTLHLGGCSLWLTSVVLLRCHKRRTACSIILCTYLERCSSSVTTYSSFCPLYSTWM
jgi:hypothetical protein